MKGLYLPAHAVPLELFNGLVARAYRQIRDQFPVDLFSPLRCSALLRMDDREREFRVLLVFADRRKNADATISDLKNGFRSIAFFVGVSIGTRVGLIFFFRALQPVNLLRVQNFMAVRPRGSPSMVIARLECI